MSLTDNVALAAGHRRIRRVWTALGRMDRRRERSRARDLLDLVGIAAHADEPVQGQPLGVLKRLEVARALALRPSLLMLDEPLAGLNHVEAARLADTVTDINREGLTIVMIEHDMGVVMDIVDRVVVLDFGRKIAEGAPAQIKQNKQVIKAYLGKSGN